MKPISTRVHGVIDYVVGGLLILAPWILGFARGGAETWIPVLLGAGIIVYSLLTDYEDGAVGLIPMTGHLVLDAVGGAFLAASPWIFGYADYIWWPHVLVGVAEIGVAALTQTVPSTSRRPGRPRMV